MKKLLLLAAVLSCSVYATQAKSQRLVVKPSEMTTEESKQRCVTTPGGEGQWRLPVAGTTEQSSSPRFQVIHIESHGYTAVQAAQYLSSATGFGHVEADVLVSAPNIRPIYACEYSSALTTSNLPDDPRVDAQGEYYGTKEDHPTGMNLFELWENCPASGTPITVAVLDSSFFENREITYAQGVSTTTMPFGVASTLAGNHNNYFLGTGAVRNATIHPIRVMDCGVGYLSDTAAIEWLNGMPIDGEVAPYKGNIGGIINISLSAES